MCASLRWLLLVEIADRQQHATCNWLCLLPRLPFLPVIYLAIIMHCTYTALELHVQ